MDTAIQSRSNSENLPIKPRFDAVARPLSVSHVREAWDTQIEGQDRLQGSLPTCAKGAAALASWGVEAPRTGFCALL
jgi:hypothetical protein